MEAPNFLYPNMPRTLQFLRNAQTNVLKTILICIYINNLMCHISLYIYNILFLTRPLKLAAMNDLRSGVKSQTQEVLHLPGVF